MLEEIVEIGLFAALGDARRSATSRARSTGGRGADGIVDVASDYLNPLAGAVEALAGV